jgi:uncharacterized membrane protein (UPF0127 family)
MAVGTSRLVKIGAVVALLMGVAVAMGTMRGCEEKTAANIAPVKIAGKQFYLEIVADQDKQFKGLGGRTHIDDDGGMLFVFPRAQQRSFVMRDCPIPIDILYLDGSGRVLSMHAMQSEPARGDGETDLDSKTGTNKKYEDRLKPYPSRFPSQLVIELQGGMIQKLGVKEGDLVQMKAEELKKLAK